MKMKSYCDLSRLTIILPLFISLSLTCTAQEINTGTIISVSVPLTLIIILGLILCVCCYSCYYNNSRSSLPRGVQTQRPLGNQYIYNSIERASTSSPDQTRTQAIARHQNRQPYSSTTVAPLSTNRLFPPIGGGPIAVRSNHRTSQTVVAPQAPVSEPVSLPEAALHQGEAPPAYTEAIMMKTVIIVDRT